MNDFGLTSILAWFSPEARMKAKRIKLQQLLDEKEKLENGDCTAIASARVTQIQQEIEAVQLDLKN